MSARKWSKIGRFQTENPQETRDLAAIIAKELSPGDLVALNGDLGAGKTVFAQGVGAGLNIPHTRPLRSPTFTIFNVHEGNFPLIHVDLYRIENPEELEALGILDLLADSVVIVEWFERSQGMLGPPCLTVSLDYHGSQPDTRTIHVTT